MKKAIFVFLAFGALAINANARTCSPIDNLFYLHGCNLVLDEELGCKVSKTLRVNGKKFCID
ncbi:MAG: hypothetical protein ACTTJC_04110 [Campylobacter sp.]